MILLWTGSTGVVDISGKTYGLMRHPKGWSLLAEDKKLGRRLYDLPTDLTSCDCADHTYRPNRPGGCKHMRGLREIVPALRAIFKAGKGENEE